MRPSPAEVDAGPLDSVDIHPQSSARWRSRHPTHLPFGAGPWLRMTFGQSGLIP